MIINGQLLIWTWSTNKQMNKQKRNKQTDRQVLMCYDYWLSLKSICYWISCDYVTNIDIRSDDDDNLSTADLNLNQQTNKQQMNKQTDR